jgi:preprotein translocase subunit SecE
METIDKAVTQEIRKFCVDRTIEMNKLIFPQKKDLSSDDVIKEAKKLEEYITGE